MLLFNRPLLWRKVSGYLILLISTYLVCFCGQHRHLPKNAFIVWKLQISVVANSNHSSHILGKINRELLLVFLPLCVYNFHCKKRRFLFLRQKNRFKSTCLKAVQVQIKTACRLIEFLSLNLAFHLSSLIVFSLNIVFESVLCLKKSQLRRLSWAIQ